MPKIYLKLRSISGSLVMMQKDWANIMVPGTWQMQGYDHLTFRNIPLEFAPYDPPRVPHSINPVGSYLRSFFMPSTWKDRRVFLHFRRCKIMLFRLGKRSLCWL